MSTFDLYSQVEELESTEISDELWEEFLNVEAER